MHLSVTAAAKRYTITSLELSIGQEGLARDMVRGQVFA